MLYCAKCKKHTDEPCPKNLMMITNNRMKGVSRCGKCLAIKSFFDKITRKDQLENILTQFLFD